MDGYKTEKKNGFVQFATRRRIMIQLLWIIHNDYVIEVLGWITFALITVFTVEWFIGLLKNPHCPRFGCWHSKTITRFGSTGNPYYCAKCQRPYWHQGWRNFIKDPNKVPPAREQKNC